MGNNDDPPADDKVYIKIGPVGNTTGTPWDEKGHKNVVQILLSHDEEINSIQFQYAENGNLLLSERHGSNIGYNFDAVRLDFPKEYLTRISGYRAYNNNHICSLSFGTNRGDYGPFGRFASYDKAFDFKLGNHRQFGGFHGTADNNVVKSIGVYLKLIQNIDDSGNSLEDGKLSDDKAGESWEMLKINT